MRFAITQRESLLNIIDTTPLGFISHSSAFPQIFYQKLDSARFPFLISKCSEVVAKGNRRFFLLEDVKLLGLLDVSLKFTT